MQQSARLSLQNMSSLVSKSQELSHISENINALQNDMDDYLQSRDSAALQSFYNNSNTFKENINLLDETADYTPRGVKIKNLQGMLNNYFNSVEKAILAKRNERIYEYIDSYQKATDEFTYINSYIESILTSDLQESAYQYSLMEKEMIARDVFSYTILATTFIVIVIVMVVFSFEITRPISKLADYAQEVTHGNYDITLEEETSTTEVEILYSTFQEMVDSIEERQFLEQQLADQQIKSLEMSNALQEAEYKALYAQVNPHFIFNTINIGAKLAMLQGDTIVNQYLENAADIFRYNLSGLKQATLKEELGNVTAYMNLMITRFGDRLSFNLDVQQQAPLDTFILPRMTLQPLVENAYIHGISQLEQGGSITVKVETPDPQTLKIIIQDSGGNFSEEVKSQVLGSAEKNQLTGIGLTNVVKRLSLFYQVDKPVDIISKEGKTQVVLTLPISSKEEVL